MSKSRLCLRVVLVLTILLVALSACVSKTDYEKLQGELRDTQQQLSAQQQEVSRLSTALSQEQARTTDLATQLSSLQSRLTDTQGQTTRLEEQVAELKGQLAAAQGRAASLETDVSRLTSALATEKRETARLEGELSQAKSASASLSQQMDNLKADLSQAQTSNTSLTQQIDKLKEDLSQAQTSNTSLTQQIDKLKVDLSQAQTTNTSLNQQVDSLKAQLSQAQSTSTALNSQIGDLRSQVTFLQSLLAARTAQTQSLAQVIAQARPAVVRIRAGTGAGSGFFFDKEGRILTNAHVVEGYTSVTVVVDDSRSLAGQVLGRHETMDVAVVRVALGKDATFLPLGDSDKAQVGEDVLAMGYPLGSELGGQATVTKGVVSAKRQGTTTSYLQIDAALNPGNSGGPLLNSRGEAIGINASGIREAGGTTIEGIGFAIAINSVKTILPSLIAGTVVATPATGASTYQNTTWRYSIQVAAGWPVEDSQKDNVRIWSPGQSALVQIFAQTVPNSYTLESWTEFVMSYRRSRLLSFTELSRSRVTLANGVPAYSSLYVATLPGESAPSKGRRVLTLTGSRGFEVVAETWESSWSRYGTALEQMALSFAPIP